MENFELSVSPIENYETPEIPTFDDNNSALLRKLPSRWKKSAKIIAGLGLIGALALSGCGGGRNTTRELFPYGIVHNLSYTQGSYRGYSNANLLVRLHTGGMGSSFYMVHLTEQEAFGIIRARLEAAGLNFDATPPPGIVFDPVHEKYFSFNEWAMRMGFGSLEFDLFDAEKDVAVTHVNWQGPMTSFRPCERTLARNVADTLAVHASDIDVGVFHNPGRTVSNVVARRRVSYRQVAESRPIIVRQLINQADTFIAQLQSEGILERFPDINVTINGEPFNHGEYSIIINNQKMVPALELFEALGMEVNVDERTYSHSITGTKNNTEIWVSSWGGIAVNRNINRNRFGDWLEDTPVIMHNDIILVPLQFVADFVSATVEWNEDARIIRIIY